MSALSLHNSKSDKSEEMNDDESLSQSLKLSMKEKEKEIVSDPAPGQSGLNKNLLPADRNQDLKSKKTLCKFYLAPKMCRQITWLFIILKSTKKKSGFFTFLFLATGIQMITVSLPHLYCTNKSQALDTKLSTSELQDII